jgi:hypothetical protein
MRPTASWPTSSPYLDELTSWDAWQGWRDLVVRRYREQGQACPLRVLTAQLGHDDPATQALIVDLFTRWRGCIAAGVASLQAQGLVGAAVDPARTAAALLAGIQGGVVIMLASGDVASLEAALDLGLQSLRDSAPLTA